MVSISSKLEVFEFSRGGGGGGAGQKPPIRGLHVTCDTSFRTWPCHSNQKSYVKIWFGLVEPFKSYRVHKQTNIQTCKYKKKKKSQVQQKTIFFSGRIIRKLMLLSSIELPKQLPNYMITSILKNLFDILSILVSRSNLLILRLKWFG